MKLYNINSRAIYSITNTNYLVALLKKAGKTLGKPAVIAPLNWWESRERATNDGGWKPFASQWLLASMGGKWECFSDNDLTILLFDENDFAKEIYEVHYKPSCHSLYIRFNDMSTVRIAVDKLCLQISKGKFDRLHNIMDERVVGVWRFSTSPREDSGIIFRKMFMDK